MSTTFDITMWTQKQRNLVILFTVGLSYISIINYLNLKDK